MRATKKQNEIIKAHFEAYENDEWGNNLLPSKIKEYLLEGNLSEGIWNHIVEYNVSITSQIMMSNDTFRYISGKAKADIRRGFITFLNQHNIK